MKPRLLRALAPALVLVLTIPCLGWGRDGHKVVAEIATARLTPEAQAEIRALLGDRSLIDVCTWADEIKSDPAFRWASPLHYANVEPGSGAGQAYVETGRPVAWRPVVSCGWHYGFTATSPARAIGIHTLGTERLVKRQDRREEPS